MLCLFIMKVLPKDEREKVVNSPWMRDEGVNFTFPQSGKKGGRFFPPLLGIPFSSFSRFLAT